MICSIIIPVWNKANFTKSCLDDLVKLTGNNEIIVVNNGSTDNTLDILAEYKNIKIITNNENLGFAKGCNVGFKVSTGDIVIFLNNDIKVENNHENWNVELIDFLLENDNYLVGPTGGLVDKDCNFIYETTESDKKINYLSGWCIAGKKNTWLKLDISGDNEIFSEEYGYGYFEDTDLGFRCKEKNINFKLISVPIKHFGHVTAKQIGVNVLYKRAKRIFVKKWKKK